MKQFLEMLSERSFDWPNAKRVLGWLLSYWAMKFDAVGWKQGGMAGSEKVEVTLFGGPYHGQDIESHGGRRYIFAATWNESLRDTAIYERTSPGYYVFIGWGSQTKEERANAND